MFKQQALTFKKKLTLLSVLVLFIILYNNMAFYTILILFMFETHIHELKPDVTFMFYY